MGQTIIIVASQAQLVYFYIFSFLVIAFLGVIIWLYFRGFFRKIGILSLLMFSSYIIMYESGFAFTTPTDYNVTLTNPYNTTTVVDQPLDFYYTVFYLSFGIAIASTLLIVYEIIQYVAKRFF